ncbi:EAL domain-containing protein [Kitasatospora paracochleata]|uniref:Diguanylate cyclase (GGDEF)-like protein/PAS domain S-box-containing protein n=1 Tax=Kitasatospora paracochleata TaxID=58354 RepID=A0ABT1ISX2_9ACTN|nr:EAL domain-containing protein [Kitasatospora paracochleata]MCP2307691.1 diguanylate cyclase (GGDEF)-like protein/PAS domain S-box-containing protein [Kitasatospora paracochleata]
MNSTDSVLSVRASRLPGTVLVALCLGYTAGAGVGWGTPELALFMGDFGLAGAALAAALSCLAHGCTVGGHTRPAWLLFGLSSAMVALGNGTWGWYEVVLRAPVPKDSLADYAFLLFAPLAILGLLVLAQRPRTPAGWLCLLLDGWLVAGSLFTLSWSLALGRVAAGEGNDPLKLALGLGYPVLDILLVSLVVGLRFRGRDGNRAAVHTAMVGLAVTVVCDALFTSPVFRSSYHSGELLDAGWFAGSVLLAWAPWSHERRPTREHHPSSGGLPRRRVASTFSALTPYVAAAVCTAGILYNALGGHAVDRVVLAAACTVGLALIVRQGVMLLDNLSLAQELAHKEAHFRSLVQGSSDVIMIAGGAGVLSYVSPAALRVYSRDPEELVGGNLLNLVHPEDVDRVLSEVRRILARSRGRLAAEPSARVECRIRSGNGEWLHVESTVNRYRDGLILNSRDVSERVRLQAQLQHNAFHDPLTDLPNRALFAHRVRAALGTAGPDGTTVAVLFLDLDGFKAVNDTAGHQVGDELLIQAARRLQGSVRADDTVARFGGDEFAVLVRGRLGRTQVQELAERVRSALSEPYWIGDAELGVAASIGIAIGPSAAATGPGPAAVGDCTGGDSAAERDHGAGRDPAGAAADELLRNADLAMYRAKSEGKGRVVLYSPAMRAELERRSELEERLRVAVREGGFTLLHQPVVELAGGQVSGIEAQARWRSAQGLLLTPAEFLRTAEQGDAATRFARWMLQEAVAAAARRRSDGLGSPPVPVTVRLAADRICAPGMYETVAAALRDSGLPPELLVIEVARTAQDSSADELGRRLTALRRLGVSTALAGLGAGGGSLGALARLPFDAVKLDRGLVQDIGDSTLSRTLAGHALRLGRDLGMITAADGVDHPRQVAVLQELGCRRAQGLAFAQPLDEARLRRALARRAYPLPRPVGALAARRPHLAPDPRTGAVPARTAHLHGPLDLPQRHVVGGPGGGPHGETPVPPA